MGLRWRYVDGSVLFSCAHVFPIAFERFTAAVDITRSIQYMNDYIGGATVVIHRDGRRRVVRQAERNLYLQQPNWMVLFGGEVIQLSWAGQTASLISRGLRFMSNMPIEIASPDKYVVTLRAAQVIVDQDVR